MNMHSTLGERVHELVREGIIAGKYQPGERLFFETIAKEAGVSMTPVKEAFMLLEKEGLVVTLSRKGTFVRELSRQDIKEYHQIRLALESLAADLISADGLAREDEGRLLAICDSLEKHIVRKEAKQCILDDVQFHRQLVAASGNQQLIKLVNTLPFTNLFNLIQKAQYYLRHGEFFLEEHRKIVRLLRKGKADAIKEILNRHIATGDHSILVAMETATDNGG